MTNSERMVSPRGSSSERHGRGMQTFRPVRHAGRVRFPVSDKGSVYGFVMGRPGKGERGFIALREPIAQHQHTTTRAQELGLDRGDYACLVMAIVHGFPIPPYIQISAEQLALIESEVARARPQLDDVVAKGA